MFTHLTRPQELIPSEQHWKHCLRVFGTDLLRQRAAVFLRHAFPHRLLDRLDLLAQRDAGRGGGFNHFSVNGLLLFTLGFRRGQAKRRRMDEWTGGKQEEDKR